MKYLRFVWEWKFRRFFQSPLPKELSQNLPTAKHPNELFSYPAAALGWGVRQMGHQGLLPLNLVLFAFGFLLLLADDYIQLHATSQIVMGLAIISGWVYLIGKFDAWRVQDCKALLKCLYILSAVFIPGSFFIMYFFLIFFENIDAYQIWGGISID